MGTRTQPTEAVVETRLVHDVHRRATSLLASSLSNRSADPDAVTTFRDFVVEMLDHHHHSEDHDLWPLLVASAPRLADPLARLTAEHHNLEAVLDGLAGHEPGDPALARTARDVRELVHLHLAHEEPVLFPALDAHLDPGDWLGFSARTVHSAPQAGIHFMAALLYEQGTADEVELMLRHLPPEARAGVPSLRAAGMESLSRLGSGGA